MKKQSIDHLFKRLDGELDTEVPSKNHKANFLAKLEAQKAPQAQNENKSTVRWIKPLLIAASTLLLAGLIFSQLQSAPIEKELADVSPEMQETQEFFTKTIERELFEIKENITPENQALVEDAITQVDVLEKEYKKLKGDLLESGEDKRVIYAMIDNFQNRINLLQNVLEQIEVIKELTITDQTITL